ncbi:MAG: hypothetical protein IKW90_12370 [Lachnospiraceae bacterium]|nr:hypothetical protein [Lachnospiraceae bacterium]
MSKPTAIILLVLLALLLFGIFKILLPSIKIYISRMPKGIFVLLFIVIVGAIVYLTHYLITGATGGNPGNEKNSELAGIEKQEDDGPKTVKENCIVLSGSEVYVENEKADSATIEKYIDYRVENNIQLTIVDDYSTAALFREIKAICDKKGVRYSIEDEKWLE